MAWKEQENSIHMHLGTLQRIKGGMFLMNAQCRTKLDKKPSFRTKIINVENIAIASDAADVSGPIERQFNWHFQFRRPLILRMHLFID